MRVSFVKHVTSLKVYSLLVFQKCRRYGTTNDDRPVSTATTFTEGKITLFRYSVYGFTIVHCTNEIFD